MLLLLALITISTLFIYFYHKRASAFNYWKQRGVPTLTERPHWFFGNFTASILGRKSFIDRYDEAHKEFKSQGHKLGGLYLMNLPMILVVDNEIMKKMLQTDFDAFAHRGISVDPVNNPLSMHLFNLDGDSWQIIRRKLSPTFTSGKMKMMLPILEKHVNILIRATKNMVKEGAEIDFHPWLDRTGIDIIGHVAFGLDCNTLESENPTFFEMTCRIMRPKIWKAMKMLFFGLSNPANFSILLSSDEEMSNYFIKLVKDTIQHRRANNIKASDFLQLLIEMIQDEEKETGSGLTMLETAAQAFVFFVAGFETTSRTIDFALYSLAKAENEQTLLRESIRKELDANKGQYTYDWLMNNDRLDMVIKETLRLYPPVGTLNRNATRDYKVEEIGITIPKGTNIVFSSYGFHHDPEYFDNPLEFRPERFSKENANQIHQFTNIAFGEGPRFCIGKRFGYLQSKMILAKLIMTFQVLPSDKTVYPFKVSPLTTNLLLASEKPIYYIFKPL